MSAAGAVVLTALELASAFEAVGSVMRKTNSRKVDDKEVIATFGRILAARNVAPERVARLEGGFIEFKLSFIDMKGIQEEVDELTIGLEKMGGQGRYDDPHQPDRYEERRTQRNETRLIEAPSALGKSVPGYNP